jgi:hypothetical protein
MSSGFYKRRRGVLEHLESGKISLLELAIHDYLCLKANGMVGTACTIPPGCCFTSSLAIHAFCPEVSERTIRRALEHLEEIGWIKRFMVRGRRGNYVAMINRFSVHDKSGNEYRVNADATTDWRNPVTEPFVESAMKSEKSGHEVSTYREVESKPKPSLPSARLGIDPSAAAVTESDTAAAFSVLDFDKPIGNPKFRNVWTRHFVAKKHDEYLTNAMEDAIQECQRDGIGVPASFFESKREVEKIEMSYARARAKGTPL